MTIMSCFFLRRRFFPFRDEAKNCNSYKDITVESIYEEIEMNDKSKLEID